MYTLFGAKGSGSAAAEAALTLAAIEFKSVERSVVGAGSGAR